MNPWLILIIIVVVIFIVWWALLRNAKTYKPDFEMHGHEEEPHAQEAISVETPVVEAPAAIDAVRATEAVITAAVEPDDLTIIEGIGPKINQLLHDAGIQTFAQLAETSVESLKAILDPAGLRFIDPGSWAEQAKLVSEGKLEAFAQLTSQLKGGRKID